MPRSPPGRSEDTGSCGGAAFIHRQSSSRRSPELRPPQSPAPLSPDWRAYLSQACKHPPLGRPPACSPVTVGRGLRGSSCPGWRARGRARGPPPTGSQTDAPGETTPGALSLFPASLLSPQRCRASRVTAETCIRHKSCRHIPLICLSLFFFFLALAKRWGGVLVRNDRSSLGAMAAKRPS